MRTAAGGLGILKAGREPQFFGEQRVLGERVQGWVIKEDRRGGGSVMAGGYTSSLTLPPLPSPWWWWWGGSDQYLRMGIWESAPMRAPLPPT